MILGIVALMLYHPIHDSVEDKFTYSLYVLNTKIADYVVRYGKPFRVAVNF